MSDTRRRTLIGLGSAALVSVLLAAFALEHRAAEGAPHYPPTEVLPGFSANVKNSAVIEISGRDGVFTVQGAPGKGWVLPGKGNYPADFDEVRHTLIGLAALQTIAPKTARPDWLHYLSLDAPHASNAQDQNTDNGTQITVKDKNGAVLASLIFGRMEDLGDPNGTAGVFVRHPGDNQAWLARTVFTPHAALTAWLSGKVLDLGVSRLHDVAVTPVKGPVFGILRDHPTDQTFTLAAAPKQGTPNAQLINAIPYAIATFSLTDVQPAGGVDFSKPTHIVARSFDGLQINIDIAQQNGSAWARLSAAPLPGATPAIAQEAQAINARSTGWAYKLPAEKAHALLTDLPQIMTPAAPQGPQGLPPGMAGMPGAAEQP